MYSRQYLIGIGLMSGAVLIQLIIGVENIRKLYLMNLPSVSPGKHIQMLTLIAMFAYTTSTIGNTIELIIRYLYYPNRDQMDETETNLNGIKDIIYYFGNVTFFSILLMRIRLSFQITKSTMYYLSTLLILSSLLSIVYCFVVLYWNAKSNYKYVWSHYLPIALYPLYIIDFLLNLSLFIIFIYKIKNKNSMEGLNFEKISIGSVDSKRSNYDKKRIWNVMIKHCVLFTIAILVNQSFYVAIIIDVILPNNLNFATKMVGTSSVNAIENTISVIILWLVLRINNAQYVYLCKYCHLGILKCCIKGDRNMIREGFIINRNNSNLRFNDKVEGHNLILTDGINN